MILHKKLTAFFILFVFFSTQTLASFNLYLAELDGTSEYYMSQNTKNRLTRYNDNNIAALHGAVLDAKHDSFNANKAQLIRDWELYTGLAWPKYTNRTKNRNRGDKFDAHHIIPQSYNGPNIWWNLIPLTNAGHHKVHTNGSRCSKLFPNSRGAGRVNAQYLHP